MRDEERERPGWTVDRTVRRGVVVRQGTEGAYQRLELGAGEPHVVRSELVGPDASPVPARHLLAFVHLTDLQLADVSSPGRLEFLQRLVGRADLAPMLPSYRAHELLAAHAFETMAATINRLIGQGVAGVGPQFALTTGDNIDNQQWNELQWFFALMNGGAKLVACAGGDTHESVHAPEWGDSAYWRPDPGPDEFKSRWGFPARPGLVSAALSPFDTTGLRLPWLACFGNHDGLVQGRALATPAYAEIVVGALKAAGVPDHVLAGGPPPDFLQDPDAYFTGRRRRVVPDPGRRLISRAEFVAAHLADGGSPHGHGFGEENLARGTAYYVTDDYPPARVVVLDSTNPGGAPDGSVGLRQFRWLEARLREVHSRFRDEQGRWVQTGNPDRLVVLASHHGLSTLTNPVARPDPYQPEAASDLPRVLAPQLRRLVHRFPNVVLWVSGHTHRNSVRARVDPAGGGFWEVCTSALMDWPCQARFVDLGVTETGQVSITATMVDHQAPPLPDDAEEVEFLAALHRELAANEPHGVGGRDAHGERTDRNVVLLAPAPFPLG